MTAVRRARSRPPDPARAPRRRGRRLRPRGRPHRRRARPRRRRLHHLRRHRRIGPPAHGRPAAPGRPAAAHRRRTSSAGAGQQVAGLTEFPPPLALASLGDAAVVRWAGAVTAQEARAVGINWVFAPVGDLDVLPDNPDRADARLRRRPEPRRQPGADLDRGLPGRRRARLRQAFSRARPHDGRLAHRPAGRGRHRAATLRESDLLPFAIAVESGVASIMTAHVAYPALDPSGAARHALAARSWPSCASRLGLRRAGGDRRADHGRRAGRAGASPTRRSRRCRPGVDLLLYPNDARRVRDALEQALASGALTRGAAGGVAARATSARSPRPRARRRR